MLMFVRLEQDMKRPTRQWNILVNTENGMFWCRRNSGLAKDMFWVSPKRLRLCGPFEVVLARDMHAVAPQFLMLRRLVRKYRDAIESFLWEPPHGKMIMRGFLECQRLIAQGSIQ